MVKIAYYKDPTKDPELSEHSTVGTFLISQLFSRDQLLDLRFFDTEMLGHEIDQKDGEFLDIDEGVVVVLHDSMIPRGPETWGYIIIAVVFAASAILLAPEIPSMGNRDQTSGTNKLGQPTNEPRLNERIDDIFGRVNKHVPPLWQVPYRIGVNNEETEVLLLCIGRGRYETYEDRIFDGNTRVKDIPNASFSIYGPGTYPGNGTPELQIGPDITEKIGVYRKSNDLNQTELLPPNDLEFGTAAVWVLNADGTVKLINAAELDVDLTERVEVGDSLVFGNTFFYTVAGQVTLYARPDGEGSGSPYVFDNLTLEDFSSTYEVTGITADTITVRLDDQSAPIQTIWSQMLDFELVSTFYQAFNSTPTLLVTTTDDTLVKITSWGEAADSGVTLDIQTLFYSFTVGSLLNGIVGPFTVDPDATEIILNFVSESGFYKLNRNTEVSITAEVQVTIAETDVDGIPTGNTTVYPVAHSSDPDKVRDPVFTTARLALPYQYQTVSSLRVTPRDKNENISNVDVINWRDIYTYEPVSGADFGDVTLAHVVIPSNSTSRLIKERRQNLDVTRKITQYLGNGQFGPAESYATDQFDQILIHMALDPYIGRMTLDDINADGFMDIRQQMIEYFGSDEMCRFGHDFDTTKLTFQDMYVMVLMVAMCKPYTQYGVYDAFFERPQTASSAQITCRNKDFRSESRDISGEQLNDGIELTYRDNTTGIQEVIYIPQDQSAVNPKRVEYPGCTSRLQAFRLASREYNVMKYTTFEVSFDVDDFGRNIIPGKRIDSPDGTRFTTRPGATDGYRVFDGEVVEVNGLEVELSEPVTFTDGEDHYITFTKNDGDNMQSILCTRVDDYTVLLSTIPEEPIYDGYSRDRTKFTLVSEQLRESIALIPRTIESSVTNDGVETNKITSINYSPNYYKDDLEQPL